MTLCIIFNHSTLFSSKSIFKKHDLVVVVTMRPKQDLFVYCICSTICLRTSSCGELTEFPDIRFVPATALRSQQAAHSKPPTLLHRSQLDFHQQLLLFRWHVFRMATNPSRTSMNIARIRKVPAFQSYPTCFSDDFIRAVKLDPPTEKRTGYIARCVEHGLTARQIEELFALEDGQPGATTISESQMKKATDSVAPSNTQKRKRSATEDILSEHESEEDQDDNVRPRSRRHNSHRFSTEEPPSPSIAGRPSRLIQTPESMAERHSCKF